MSRQSNWSCIRDEGSADNTNCTSPDSSEKLDDCLNFGVIERIGTGISIHTHGIDGTLVAGVQCGCAVGRIGDVTVEGMRLKRRLACETRPELEERAI